MPWLGRIRCGAVCSLPERRGSWSTAEFLATGEAEIAGILGGLQQHGLLPPMGRAMDFGCGLGRLSRALSNRFTEVVGVDLSEQMVAQARASNNDVPNCDFVVNPRADLATFEADSFDSVLSLIALQHVARRDTVRTYIREFVRVTAPGGVLVFQVPSEVAWRIRYHPLRLANRAVHHLPWVPDALVRRLINHSMRLTALSERDVRSLLTASGAAVATAFQDDRGGSQHIRSMTYVATVR